MCDLETFRIDLNALDEGQNRLAFNVDDAFFEAIDAQEVRRGNVHVTLDVLRSGSIFRLQFHSEGVVMIPCDLCLDDMEQPIEADNRLTARLGAENSEDDDTVTVAEDEGILDVAWFVYEFIALAIPIKHVHAPGKCNAAMTQKLEELSAARSSDRVEGATDPRWKALEKLKS